MKILSVMFKISIKKVNKFQINPGSLLFYFLFILFIASCLSNNTQNPVKSEILTPLVVFANVDKVEATTGDIITFRLNLNYVEKIEIKIPDLKKHLSDFRILEEKKEPPVIVDNRIEEIIILKLQVKETGSYIIQPVKVDYSIPPELVNKFGKSASSKTSRIYIEVKSVLKPGEKDTDIEDIKPPENIPVINKMLVYLLVIFIIVIFVAIFAVLKYFKKPEKKLLPHEKAFHDLDILINSGFLKREEYKKFYFCLSEILRKYLKERFDFPAMEKTSGELGIILENSSEIASENKEFIIKFLEKTDFYKYTDYTSGDMIARKLFESTEKFIESTKLIPEPKDKKGIKND